MIIDFLPILLTFLHFHPVQNQYGYEPDILKHIPTPPPEVGETFIFQNDNNFKIHSNWLDQDIPCDDDYIRIDPEKEVVARIEDGLRVNKLYLPNDGVIYFQDKTEIGKKARWQCPKRKSPEDVNFHPPGMLGSFLNPKKWKIAGDIRERPRLHCEMVPSQNDEVIFPNDQAIQVQIDQVVAARKVKYNDQYQTSDSLWNKMLTIEGQYVFQLGPLMRADRNFDGIEYKFPTQKPILVDELPRSKASNKNYNSKDNIMKSLCQFIKCDQEVEQNCKNPIRPNGHCCPVCGATMTFRMQDLDFWFTSREIEGIEKSYGWLKDLGIRLARLDENDPYPEYQIFVFGDYAENYDEAIFYEALMKAWYRILSGPDGMNPNTGKPFMYTQPKIEYSYQKGKLRFWHFLVVLIAAFVICCVGYASFQHQYRSNFRFRNWWDNNSAVEHMTVVWRQTKDYAEEKVDLMLHRSIGEEAPTSFAPEDLEQEAPKSGSVQEVVEAEFSNEAFLNEIPDDPKTEAVEPIQEETKNLIDIDF